jgi:3-deoxy-D-manno-octulosonic-acid transferase
VFYLPLDTKQNAKRFVDLINPEFVLFVKYEFWRNFLFYLKKRQIPVYLISAIFRKEQIFFSTWGRWYKNVLGSFKWFFVQNAESTEILNSFGYKNNSISGDTRFDRVFQIAQAAKRIPVAERFSQDNFTIIIGSSWKADEEILFSFINQNHNQLKFIIAPHEIHESNIQRIITSLKVNYQRYSIADSNTLADVKVLLIDNIGMLSSIYQYGKIAYIGGGFGSGIHNILEAATFGLPVLFGPNYEKYKEAVDLIEQGGAFQVSDDVDVTNILNHLIEDSEYLEKTSNVCKKYVEENRGACSTIMKFLKEEHKGLN